MVSLTLPVRANASSSAEAAKIAASRKQQPEALAKASPAIRVDVLAGSLEIEAPGALRVSFFPGRDCVEVPAIVQQGDRKGDRLSVSVEQAAGGRIVGLVKVERASSPPKGYWIDLPAAPPPPAVR